MGEFSIWHWVIVASIVLGMFAVLIVPSWVIAAKTGRSGALSLLNLVPVLGSFVFLFILAFGNWPIEAAEEAE